MGYSQGGGACVATLRAIQNEAPDEFNVVTTLGGSGPYNVSGVQFDFIANNPFYPTPGYIPFVLLGNQPIYQNLYNDVSEVLVPPWDADLPMLLDRNHPVRVALRDNDLLDFTPKSPLWMTFCMGDEQVDFRNAIVAWIVYKLIRRSPAPVIPLFLGPGDHGDCALPSLVLGKLLFDAQRIE
jgi:hypothetical protein